MDTTPAFLPTAEIAKRYSIARSYLDKLVAAGRWPAPARFGTRCIRHDVALCDRFVRGEVDAAGRPIEQETA